jgi:hypothetical protein
MASKQKWALALASLMVPPDPERTDKSSDGTR